MFSGKLYKVKVQKKKDQNKTQKKQGKAWYFSADLSITDSTTFFLSRYVLHIFIVCFEWLEYFIIFFFF